MRRFAKVSLYVSGLIVPALTACGDMQTQSPSTGSVSLSAAVQSTPNLLNKLATAGRVTNEKSMTVAYTAATLATPPTLLRTLEQSGRVSTAMSASQTIC